MSFYNTESLPNFSTRDPTVRLQSQVENNKRFALNAFGNGDYNEPNFIVLPESATNPSTPYVLSLEQSCNNGLFLESPINTDAFDGSGNLVYADMKTYYIQAPYGNQSILNPYFGPLDLSYDAQLWQAWKAVFGFDKIPIGFNVGFTLQVSLGTQVVITIGTPNQNFPYVRSNPFNYIPGIGLAQSALGVNTKFSSYTPQYVNATVYTEMSDADFATYYPKEYNTPAASLVGPQIHPFNAQV